MCRSASALPRAVLFDMDGTLVDSTALWLSLPDAIVRQLGCVPKPTLYADTFPLGTREIAEFIHKDYHTRQSAAEIFALLDRRISRYYTFEATLKPGAAQLLHRLRGAGVRLALATATMERYARAALRCTGVLTLFDAVFTTDQLGHCKAEAAFFEAAVRDLDAAPDEVWLFEDATYSARTAKAPRPDGACRLLSGVTGAVAGARVCRPALRQHRTIRREILPNCAVLL